MRQYINNNWIAYTLLTGLFVCGVLFVATPVMAQTETSTTNSGLSTLETFGTVGGIGVVLLLALLSGAVGIGRLQEKVKNNKEALDAHKGEGEKRVNELKDILTPLSQQVSKIEGILEGQKMSKTTSPLQHTDRGKENFKNSGCKEYFEKHLKEWLKLFEGINTDYEIHDKASDIVADKYNDAENTDADLKRIKAFMFNEGVPREETLLMMSIGLRNMICEKKGIVIKKKEQQVQK